MKDQDLSPPLLPNTDIIVPGMHPGMLLSWCLQTHLPAADEHSFTGQLFLIPPEGSQKTATGAAYTSASFSSGGTSKHPRTLQGSAVLTTPLALFLTTDVSPARGAQNVAATYTADTILGPDGRVIANQFQAYYKVDLIPNVTSPYVADPFIFSLSLTAWKGAH